MDVLDKKMVELILVQGDVKIQMTVQRLLNKKWMADKTVGKKIL